MTIRIGVDDDFVISEHTVAYKHCHAIDECGISPDGNVVVSSSRDRKVRAVNIQPLESTTFDLPINSASRMDVSVSSTSIATSTFEDGVSVWKPPDFRQKLMSKFCKGNSAIACVLTSDGVFLFSAFKAQTSCQLFLTHVRDNQDFGRCETGRNFFRLIRPSTRHVVLFTETNTDDSLSVMIHLKMWDTTRNTIIELMQLKAYPGICTQENARRVFVADHESLRIKDLDRNSVISLPNYAYSGCGVAISATPDGGTLVVSVTDNCFDIWDTNRRVRIATLRGHGAPFKTIRDRSCAISADCSTVVTAGTDRTVRVWKVPPLPSPLQKVCRAVFDNPHLLDKDLLLTSIVSRHVQSVPDLFAGHNLVLFAIRIDVLTCGDLRTFGGTEDYFFYNLYYPASRLLHGDISLLHTIFKHAHEIGIIESVAPLTVANLIRHDFCTDFARIQHNVDAVARRVNIVERRTLYLDRRVDRLEDNLRTCLTGLQPAISALDSAQQETQHLACCLAESLTSLHENIRARDKRMRLGSLARCMISLVPLVGHALGEVALAAAEVAFELHTEDVIMEGVAAAKEAVITCAHVDLSNVCAVRRSLSDGLASMPEEERDTVLEAVSESPWKDVREVVAVLEDVVAKGMEDRTESMHRPVLVGVGVKREGESQDKIAGTREDGTEDEDRSDQVA